MGLLTAGQTGAMTDSGVGPARGLACRPQTPAAVTRMNRREPGIAF